MKAPALALMFGHARDEDEDEGDGESPSKEEHSSAKLDAMSAFDAAKSPEERLDALETLFGLWSDGPAEDDKEDEDRPALADMG